MNKRKSGLIFLGILLSPIILFFLYIYISSLFTRTNVYYISEVNMYIKTILKPRDKFCYIILGDNQNIELSDEFDYFKFSICESCSISMLINRNEKNKIVIDGNFLDEHLKNYKISRKVQKLDTMIVIHENERRTMLANNYESDSVFYKKKLLNKNGNIVDMVKEPYILISLNNSSVHIKKPNDIYFKEIFPIK